jgi:DNA-binding transcriptional LysR family regulator
VRAVAETHGFTTPTVSQQIAALTKEVGAQLIEPDGRRVRLTPAGRRFRHRHPGVLETVPLWSTPWGLGVPEGTPSPLGDACVDLAAFAERPWIVNSRNTADEDAVRTLAALAGFTPRIVHAIDSLELLEDLIVGGYGVGFLPLGRPTGAGITLLALTDPELTLTAYATTRRGRSTWPPLRLVLDRLAPPRGGARSLPVWPRPAARE